MDPLLFVILAYVLLQLGIGAWISRRIRTEEDYLVAGRSLGPYLAMFTIFATWFGAETCIGASGEVYENGISGGSADPFGYALCILLMGLVLAVPIWRLRLTTLADFYRLRFSARVEYLAVLLMIPTSLLWAAAQVRAFGQVLAASSGLEVEVTITVAAFIVILYTLLGGLLADAWTDLIQGIALVIGLAVLLAVLLYRHGTGVFESVPQAHWQILGGSDRPLLEVLEEWAIPVLGSVTAAELLTRAIAARSAHIARGAAVVAALVYALVGMIPVLVGLAATVLLPEADAEHVLPLMAQELLPSLLYAVFAGALVSAILSTVDSTLLVSASLLSHNVLLRLRPARDERAKVRTARICVAGFGVLAYVLAFHAEGVHDLVEEASSFGSAGLLVAMGLGLFTPLGGPRAAAASLVGGVLSYALCAYAPDLLGGADAGLAAYPFLLSVATALLLYLLVALLVERQRFARARPVPAPSA